MDHDSCLCSHIQLPHLPHISEGLMKRNLRRGDMRDMSLGQLQVITNDLHAQIQSECEIIVIVTTAGE